MTVPSIRTIVLMLVFCFLVSGCSDKDIPRVALEKKTVLQPQGHAIRRQTLRIGMGAMITPKDGFRHYQRLRLYLENKMGVPIQLVDRDNYDQLNHALAKNEVDAAFLCAGPYVEGHDRFGLELVAVPVVRGKTVYYSYIIVPKDSPAHTLADLRGKRFAFTDPKSNSGKLVPEYLLAQMNETSKSFFAKTVYTYGHDKSIRAVSERIVDGAAVDSLIWDSTSRSRPELTAQTRIILRSDPYGIPPFAVRKGLDPAMKRALKESLVTMHLDPTGKEVLTAMDIDRFEAGRDGQYDTVRTIMRFVGERSAKR